MVRVDPRIESGVFMRGGDQKAHTQAHVLSLAVCPSLGLLGTLLATSPPAVPLHLAPLES